MNPKQFIRKNLLPVDANRYAKATYYQQLLNNCFAKGTLSAATRQVDTANPLSWSFSAFSQNGEDGIIDFLLGQLNQRNRYFVEIGSGDGLENNSSYLAHVKK